MLKIIIELWPKGNEAEKKIIAEGVIANNGTGNDRYGNYCYALRNGSSVEISDRRALAGEGEMEGHYREENAWELLRKVLDRWNRSGRKNVRRC